MNYKLLAFFAIIAAGTIGTTMLSVTTASAASDQACQNQIERHDRFLDRDIDDGNPNNDRGASQSHQNSHKTLSNVC